MIEIDVVDAWSAAVFGGVVVVTIGSRRLGERRHSLHFDRGLGQRIEPIGNR
ncbi:hypothetical protein D3C83_166350 [compost metagenome]